jgi:hypothetical protein
MFQVVLISASLFSNEEMLKYMKTTDAKEKYWHRKISISITAKHFSDLIFALNIFLTSSKWEFFSCETFCSFEGKSIMFRQCYLPASSMLQSHRQERNTATKQIYEIKM